MELDQRAFAWLYHSLRRLSGKSKSDEVDALVETLTHRLETLGQLISGEEWEVRPCRGMGGVAPGRLLLPTRLGWLPEPEDQASFYLYRVVLGVMAVQLGLEAGEHWSPRRRALAMLIALPRIRQAVVQRYPGAESLAAACEATLSTCFPFPEQTPDAQCFSIACRAMLRHDLGGAVSDSGPSVIARALFEAATQPEHAHRSLDERSAEFERALIRTSKRKRDRGEYLSPWGFLMPAEAQPTKATLEPPNDPESALPSGTERRMRRRPLEIDRVDLESQKDRDNPLVHSFEKVHTATEYQSGRKQLDGSDRIAEEEDALDELDLTKLTRTREPAHSVYRADLLADPHSGDLRSSATSSQSHRYPEWHARRSEYRADWCTVHEHLSPPSGAASTVTSASRRLRGEVLRLQAELKRLQLDRRWRNRQLDGSEIDIDALVDRQADLLAHRRPDRRIYVRRKLHDSHLAVLVLVDASSSSDSWVSGKRVFDVIRDSAQVLIEAFDPTSAKVCLGAFYSNTRRDCRFLLAKAFDESAEMGLRRLHALAPTGYTRIGPALRHSTAVLQKSGARRRLVLLLTDGKPTDYDHYEGQYGIEDVRQALREAYDQGIHCLALAVRESSEPYLTQMFGTRGWVLLPAVQALPGRFVSVAREFLRS